MCVSETDRKIIVFSENKRSARFSNALEQIFDEGQVDDCLIKGDTLRCDAFLRSEHVIWLVELKGRDVEHAVDQIVSTSHVIPDETGEREIVPVIVATRCPAISGQQKVLRRLKDIKGNFCGNVVLRSRVANLTV